MDVGKTMMANSVWDSTTSMKIQRQKVKNYKGRLIKWILRDRFRSNRMFTKTLKRKKKKFNL